MADASYGDRPFASLRNWLKHWRKRGSEHEVRDSLEELIEEREEAADPIDPHERTLIANVLKLRNVTAGDVMVPRVDIVALPAEMPFDQAVRFMVEQGHSRLPVFRETLDDVLGMVHIKDVLPHVSAGQPVPLTKLVRKVLFVAPSMRVLDLLLQMRLSRIHMALIVDEFGGIDGIVTIEDLVEEIVGEIEDEHDDADAPKLIERGDGTLLAHARMAIADLEAHLGMNLRAGEGEEEVDTLGGLIFMLAGRVPTRGEVVRHPLGLEFEVLDADPRRVKRLRIRNVPPKAAAANA